MSNRVLAATELLIALIVESQKISNLLLTAQGEGRDISDDEWNEIITADNAARARLENAIASAKAREGKH